MTDAATKPFDVAELKPCFFCQRGVAHRGTPVFYEVTVGQCVLDVHNIQRIAGMEQVMGGNVAIARMFSPSTTVAQRIVPAVRHVVCMECAVAKSLPIAVMLGEDD